MIPYQPQAGPGASTLRQRLRDFFATPDVRIRRAALRWSHDHFSPTHPTRPARVRPLDILRTAIRIARRDPHARRDASQPYPSRRLAAGSRAPHRPALGDRRRQRRRTRPGTRSRDAFALLDHRTRARSLPLADAPPGRYLSLEDGEDDPPGPARPADRPHRARPQRRRAGRGSAGLAPPRDHRPARRRRPRARRPQLERHVRQRPRGHGRLARPTETCSGSAASSMRFVEIAPPVRARPVAIPLAAIARRQVVPRACCRRRAAIDPIARAPLSRARPPRPGASGAERPGFGPRPPLELARNPRRSLHCAGSANSRSRPMMRYRATYAVAEGGVRES